MKSIRLSHLSEPLVPLRPYLLWGSRMAFQSSTNTNRSEHARNGSNRRKKNHHPKLEATSATTRQLASPEKTTLTSSSRFRPASRETMAKCCRDDAKDWEDDVVVLQYPDIRVNIYTVVLKFTEHSPSKARTPHPRRFKVARFRVIRTLESVSTTGQKSFSVRMPTVCPNDPMPNSDTPSSRYTSRGHTCFSDQ